jgi:putative ABC transport system permease protein
MLKLQGIYKEYQAGDTTVHALKDINIEFRKNEFVSILGPSGCGKTTLLNIIGGLDRYTSGDLSINGKSTKEFKDTDWDSYRNHSIGFVFQNYNLIPHQTVLSNVELALTLSGVSKSERKQRAIDALTKVGLADQIYKKPNQMSGGQMQRVAIARALVNNPEILLADEPTGALDSETSVQIMEILKEIAKEKLIIMVTHNPDLAREYSTRIIRLFDGNVKSDSDPYVVSEFSSKSIEKGKKSHSNEKRAMLQKRSMSMFTALSLSMNNLMTKKTRTFMTAFAGSIGIIGIALILSLSNGIQTYIDNVQKDTLSAYPISIETESVDMTSLMSSIVSNQDKDVTHDLNKVYSNPIMGNMMETMVEEVNTNNLESFKKELDRSDSAITAHASTVQYGYNLDLNIYSSDTSDEVTQLNPSAIFDSVMQSPSFPGMSSMYSSQLQVWEEMLGNQDLLDSQYDVLSGRWPSAYDEVVLMVDENNEISDIMMYALGLKDPEEMEKVMSAAMKGEVYETNADVDFTFDELLSKTFKLVLPSDYYKYDETNKIWMDMRENKTYMTDLVDKGVDLKIVGIIRPNEDAVSTSMSGAIGYTSALTDYVINHTNESEIVKQQLSAPEVDVFTGIEFSNGEEKELTMDDVNAYIDTLDEATKEQTKTYISSMPEDQVLDMFKEQITVPSTDATYEGNLETLGIVDIDTPSTINLYASSFNEKEAIADAIQDYNKKMTEEGKEEYVIQYTDIVGLMMSSVSSIVNVISYVLIAFVAISLVVSSIMIGIITYISVLERTKEIGILRSIGASKKDISRVFNAETLIVGFVSGLLGIVITILLNLPVNMIIKSVSGISGVSASLPIAGGVVLILISMFLTLLGGFIPSKLAAKKDPVVALRSE